MADKVIDINPDKRISKDSLDRIQEIVKSLSVDSLDSLIIIHRNRGEGASLEAYGYDWDILGRSQGYLEFLRAQLLEEDTEIEQND